MTAADEFLRDTGNPVRTHVCDVRDAAAVETMANARGLASGSGKVAQAPATRASSDMRSGG